MAIKKYESWINGGDFQILDFTMYVGSPADIKSAYGSIYRAWQKGSKTDLMPVFAEKPRFNMERSCYGIIIDCNDNVKIINSDSVADILVNCFI